MPSSGIFSTNNIEVKIGDIISCKIKATSITEFGINIDSILVGFDKGCYCIRPIMVSYDNPYRRKEERLGFIPIYQLSEIVLKENP